MNNDLLSISVVVPTYNRETKVQDAIDSIMEQSIPVTEIIVVDDGSTDNTKNILKKYGNKIRYIYQNNSGVAAARNTGIKAASSEWVAFLDSDDLWHKEKVKKQIAVLRETDVAVCCTGYEDDSNSEYVNLISDLSIGEHKYFRDAQELIFGHKEHPLIQSMLIKKPLILKLGLFDERLSVAEDTQLMYKIAMETGIAYINEPLFLLNRERTTPGLTDNKDIDASLSRYECSYIVQNEAYKELRKRHSKYTRSVRRNVGYFLSRLAEINTAMKRYPIARRYAVKGLRYAGDNKTFIRCLLLTVMPSLFQEMQSKKWGAK